MTDSNFTIGFIGLGLIGGSIAKGIRRVFPNYTLIGMDENPDTIKSALEDGIIDSIATDCKTDFAECNYVFLCAPVQYNVMYLKDLKGSIHENCILTDVGSVKEEIHLKIEELGALTIILDYKQHDAYTAAISHVPHIMAAELVHIVSNMDTDDGILKQLAAGGFKDITRIASSSPVVWEQISLSNKKNIKELLQKAQNHLGYVIAALDMGDREYLNNYFKQAGEYRDSVPDSAVGLIQKSYEIFIDIPDEPGTIATTTTLLALNHVSIKNIGIIHNREFEEGVLKIMLYDDESAKKATKILRDKNYTVYERK